MKIFLFCTLWITLLTSFISINREASKSDIIFLEISWKRKNNSEASYFWMLEKSSDSDTNQNIVFNDAKYKIIPLLSPRYSVEYLFCCENNSVQIVDIPGNKKLVDSLGRKYEKKFSEYYNLSNNRLKLRTHKFYFSSKYINSTEYSIRVYKTDAIVCKCKASSSNPGSSYSDTIANVSSIRKFYKFSRKEKIQISKNLSNIFSNISIREILGNN